MVAVLLGRGLDPCDIGATRGLGYGQRRYFLTRLAGGDYLGLDLVATELLDRWQTDVVREQGSDHATGARHAEFPHQDEAHQGVTLAVTAVLGLETVTEDSDGARLFIEIARNFAVEIPLMNVRGDFLLGELTDDVGVGAVIVGVEGARNLSHVANDARPSAQFGK